MAFSTISILGVGLLGGSIGLAAKAAGINCRIKGYGHRASTVQRALEIGAIDEGTSDPKDAVRSADLVVLCTPVGVFPGLLQELGESLSPGAVVTDVGSTKRSVVRLAEAGLPKLTHFVGSHPMAGSERRGVEYARADLFQNAMCILTPTERTHAASLQAVGEFWQQLGMRLTTLDPDTHDRLLADVSHLPHAVAAALVWMQEETALGLTGKGFLDTTRVAGGDGGLWRDIFLDNRDHVLASIGRLKQTLTHLEGLMERQDGQTLAQWLDAAAARREDLVRRKVQELES
jgi:prephenate dehydrogenase